MLVKDNYIINRHTVMIAGEYAFDGMLCSRVLEGKEFFLVTKSPLALLETTLLLTGSNLKAAFQSARINSDKKSMCPFIADPIHIVCLFPDISPYNHNCIFFNPQQIKHTYPQNKKTMLIFKNGFKMKSELNLLTFKNKLESARQLFETFSDRAKNGSSVYSDPENLPEIIREGNKLAYQIKFAANQENPSNDGNDTLKQ